MEDYDDKQDEDHNKHDDFQDIIVLLEDEEFKALYTKLALPPAVLFQLTAFAAARIRAVLDIQESHLTLLHRLCHKINPDMFDRPHDAQTLYKYAIIALDERVAKREAYIKVREEEHRQRLAESERINAELRELLAMERTRADLERGRADDLAAAAQKARKHRSLTPQNLMPQKRT